MDAYQPCPCGSGKKVKFCCIKIVPEMEKIDRLQDNQPEMAMQHLDKLNQQHPDNPWIACTRASIHLQQNELKPAKLTLVRFLKDHPDHPRANALYAYASLLADGLPQAKKAMHRAFKRSVADNPMLVAILMEALASYHLQHENYLATRAHIMLALRAAGATSERERIIRSLIEFDADASIPPLLRGGHHLPKWEPPAAQREQFEKARRLSLLACWEEAADILDEIATQVPESGDLQRLLGLFRAYDGDGARSATHLHRAAELYGDNFNAAVECESLAQIQEQRTPERALPMQARRFEVSSLSLLLSRLDEHPLFFRDKDDPSLAQQRDQAAALYLVLDRPMPPRDEFDSLTVDTVPLYNGRVMLFDASPDDDEPATAVLTGLQGPQLDAVVAQAMEAADGLLKPFEQGDETAEDSHQHNLGWIARDELPLHRNYYVPGGVSGPVRTGILDGHWNWVAENGWLNSPQTALGGKSPQQAAGDASLRVPLAAALINFDAFAEVRRRIAPFQQLWERLQLPPLEPAIQGDEPRGDELYSVLDLYSADPTKLSDPQLDNLLRQLRTFSNQRMFRAALEEWCRRGPVDPPAGTHWTMNRQSTVQALSAVCTDARQFEDALRWNDEAYTLIDSGAEYAFESKMLVKMRELRLRAESQPVESLNGILVELWETYGPKLPRLREQLTRFVEEMRIDPPWETSIVTAGGDWTQQASSGGDSKKLWLPGQ
ncbi:MAG: tetratricopeptide repeat protein [Planctomycetaceae bacterium]